MLSYKIEGKGSPVVLLHAFPLSSRMWQSEIKAFALFAKIIVPDLPGFGESLLQKEMSIAEMAKSVAELLDHLGERGPVFIAGLSMGGYIAFEFMRQFPARVKGLGLFSTRATPDSPEAREKRFKAVEAIQTHGIEAFGKKMIENLLGETTRRAKPEIVREVMDMILANRAEGPVNALKAMADRRDSTDILPSIHCPVLIVAGEEDTLIPAEAARELQSRIQGSELRFFPKTGHLINLEQPDLFQKMLKDFLNRK